MKKGSIIYECEWCHQTFKGSPSRAKAVHICCSRECSAALKKATTKTKHDSESVICPICQKQFWVKTSHRNRYQTPCCSMECAKILRSQRMTGENNHQFGLKGNLNPTWKSDEKITHYGYRMIRNLEHPFSNKQGFVFEHRLVVEQYLLTEENSIEIDGKQYLNPEYEVHHIDFNKLNNQPDNLLVLTKAEHKKLHNLLHPQPKDPITGRFIRKSNEIN